MGRSLRKWYPGAIYHIMCRGNHGDPVFFSQVDFQVYMGILTEVMEENAFVLHAVCLMTNHVHLQIETKQDSISHIMKRINQRYTMYFNSKYKLIGHLWQGRFRSELIETLSYFLEASRYIHRNPLEAKIVESPASYPWSSFAVYAGEKTSSAMRNTLTTDAILSHFASPVAESYRHYVEDDTKDRVSYLENMTTPRSLPNSAPSQMARSVPAEIPPARRASR